ncbi:TPA: restriction endonuclease subunit S [Streptococcus suis]
MPNKDKNIPKRRFKEFENEDAWELRKLGEVAEIVMGQSPDSKNYTDNPSDKILVQGNADLKDGFVIPRVWTTQVTKTAEKGDLILSVRAPVGDVGKTNYDVVLGRGVAGIKGNEFIYHLLVKMKLFGYWTKLSTGSTFESINSDDIKNSIISLPSLPEQEAIGTFFSTLDQQITLHQRKLDKLKHVKQAYLSEMFPAEGERVPKRRFPGFTDDWELRKLGEVVYRSNITSSSKVLPRLEFEDINSGLGTLNKDIFQKVNNDRKGLEFNEGDVLFGKLRPYLKNWWYAEFNGIALGDFWNLKSDVWHSCFLYTYIQSNAFQLVANDTSGTKMPRSDWNLVAESIAKFPSLPEQKAIGTFFSTLDQQITLHQRKLEKLKNLKKALLNELFV